MAGYNARNTNQQGKSRQRLQRTLRSLPSDSPRPPEREPIGRSRPPAFSGPADVPLPDLPVQKGAEMAQEVQYQCTSCDMMVGSGDSYCPFCGAIFADGPTAEEVDEEEPEEVEVNEVKDSSPVSSPSKFDVFSIVKPRAKSRELLYAEAMHGFAGSARLLEDLELMISEVSAIGCDTKKARRLMSDAWEACREGDWPLVSALARQTEETVAPDIPDLVRTELSKARNLVVEAKMKGIDSSKYIVMMKAAMNALHRNDIDEALRTTKQLVDLLREDTSIVRSLSRSR